MAELYRSVYDPISTLNKRANFSKEAGSQTRSEIAQMKTSSLRFALIAMLLAISMVAVSQEYFLGGQANRKLLRLQEKADSDFSNGDYGSALEIYQQELAPLGDKYSQYMVGYMYLAGKGIQEDAILASAWYRLAAQRENEQYVRICDGLLALFNDEQLSRSDQLYVDLRQDIGDLTLVNKLIQDDMKVLRRRNAPEILVQLEFELGKRRFKREDFDAAVVRIESRIELMGRQMALEKTLEEVEKEELTKLLDEAEKEVDAYKVSR